MPTNNDDNSDGAGYPLFTYVDENIFKKETFLGKRAEKHTEAGRPCDLIVGGGEVFLSENV